MYVDLYAVVPDREPVPAEERARRRALQAVADGRVDFVTDPTIVEAVPDDTPPTQVVQTHGLDENDGVVVELSAHVKPGDGLFPEPC